MPSFQLSDKVAKWRDIDSSPGVAPLKLTGPVVVLAYKECVD
jgi:hypothetical protein